MASVFISYSVQDRDIATRLASDLKNRGVDVWFDKDQILAGDSIIERVRDGIRDADYLLVLLSEHSLHSAWVTKELEVAFRVHREDTQRTVIPILLDESPVPNFLATIRYLDFRLGYTQVLNELFERIKRDEIGQRCLDNIIDSDGFARAIAKETTPRKGIEYYVTTALSIITIMVALFAAWPSFQSAFGTVPKVYYDVKNESITIPASVNETKVLQILEENGVAPASLRVRVINKGKVKASEVRVGVSVEGQVMGIETLPKAETKPVWVDLEIPQVTNSSKEGRLLFKNLVPEKPVVANLGIKPSISKYDCVVVADGLFATKVEDINLIPSWSLVQEFKKPLYIIGIGLLLSFLVGLLTVASRNPRFREKLLDVILVAIPIVGKIYSEISQQSNKAQHR